MVHPGFGRFGDAAVWIVVALTGGPRPVASLLLEVRQRGGPTGPGTVFGAIVRLERAALIEPIRLGAGQPAYRLVPHGTERP